MAGQSWRRMNMVMALGLLWLASVVCALPGGGEGTPTPTSTPETPGGLRPTLTPTLVAGGGTGGATPEPTLAPLCPNLELEIEFQQTQVLQMEDLSIENEMSASGTLPLTVNLGVSPPTVQGEAQFPVTGGGHVGDCVFDYSGNLAYMLEGEIVSAADGHLELRLGGQRAMNVAISNPSCPGGGGAPFEDIGEVALAYAEGEALAWDWGFSEAGVEGSSRWVLHIPCEE